MAFSLEKQQGRLVVTKITAPVVAGEGKQYLQMMMGVLAPMKGQTIMLTDVSIPHADKVTTDAYIEVMRAQNGKLLRSAIFAGHSPTTGLIIYNMVKGFDNPARRVFMEAAQVATWLGEVLDESERRVLDAYLAVYL